MRNFIGKKYDKLGLEGQNRNGRTCSRVVVQGYQQSPNEENYASTPFEIDLKGLNRRQQRNNIQRECESAEYLYKSIFTIGMEVEKSRISREVLRGSTLENFCFLMKGIERDGSCGLEAITNILPLVPKCKWRNKMFNMMYEANHLIDEEYSQSDEMNSNGAYLCGGHITISSLNHSSTELLKLMRPYIGIIYALNRKRLCNRFCSNNVNARTTSEPRTSQFNLGHSKYQPIFEKGNGKLLEFRLWSRFTSVKQMINRYKMMSIIVDYAVNDRGSCAKLMKKLKPILLSMYNNNEVKVNELIELSRHFSRFLMKNKVNEYVLPFLVDVDITRSNYAHLTPTAKRMVRSSQIRFARHR
tara:strand:+ start:9235 stop:10305 length:1071 start_codon:yes stop_codon:yes gene_type:complete